MGNLPFDITNMIGELTEILSMPEGMLRTVIDELEENQLEQLTDRETVNTIKRQLIMSGSTLESLQQELSELIEFKKDTAAKREFDNAQQERLFDFLIKYLTDLYGVLEKEGLTIPLTVQISKVVEEATIPVYKNIGDAGADAYVSEDITFEAGETKLVPLGIKLAIPMGYEVQLRLRSSIAFKTPLRLANGVGTIDCGYRDQVYALIWNSSNEQYTINKGERVVQLVLAKVEQIEWNEVEDVAEIGQNRGGGIGSTGLN